ncbi:MAG: Calx-beta domain-containing protein, partial [Thermoanaerobaculia bacterium]
MALGLGSLGSAPVAADGPPDSNGFVMFRGASFPVQESAAAVEVIVRRHNGDTGEVTVAVATVDGSAIDGEDYVAASTTLTWLDGDHSDKSLTIEILSDDIAEGLETFGVVLSNPTGGVEIGALGSTVVRILPQGDDDDDEDFPAVSRIRLRSAVFPAFESAGAATFVVFRQGASAGAASVDYSTVDGSALAGADYAATNGTVHWADGEAGEKVVSVPLINDAVAERHETVSVMLTNAVGGELGHRDTASILIIDDDGGSDEDCIPDEETLCLEGGRFALRGTWTDFQGRNGAFRAVPSTDGSGLFWFFDENSIEVIAKVIDGC